MAKTKKASEDEDTVYGFLSTENRPFSVQNIVDALQKAGVKKTAVERSLASLVEKNRVTKKEYGKAKIFILAQDSIELPDPEEVKRLDSQLRALTSELEEVTARVSEKRERLATLQGQLTFDAAKEKVRQVKEEFARKKAKRDALGDGSALMSKEDKDKLELAYYNIRMLWKKHKRVVTDLVCVVSEGTGQKPRELYQDIGIETDEDANVNFSDFPDIANPAKRRTGSAHRPIKRLRAN